MGSGVRRWIAAVGGVCVLTLLFAGLVVRGVIRLNTPPWSRYPVRGVDVSHYQGSIDWEALRAQGVDFAFIKATEGSSMQDDRFLQNLDGALSAGVRAGAYHFFSFDSSGRAQAENFIRAVPLIRGMLPCAVDVEFYGDKAANPPDVAPTRRELRALLEALEAAYGRKPVIYATQLSYRKYVAGAFDDYDLWIRNVYLYPMMPEGRDWTFWQYSDKGKLDGCEGVEPYIDLNVFCGSEAEFEAYGR